MAQISVIVPVYKVEKYIHRCVDSILAQTYADFELILVDDGSPDNCGAICDEYAARDNRVVVIHQDNGGLSAARNAGIDWAFANSDSQWLTFIDSDDWVLPQYLEFLYYSCQENRADISVCQLYGTKDNRVSFQEVVACHVDHIGVDDFCCAEDEEFSWVAACAKLYGKQTFADYRFPVGLINEDLYAVPYILFSNSTISVVRAPLYIYFLSPDSITRSAWTPKRMDEIHGYELLLTFLKNQRNDAVYYCTMRRFLYVLGVQVFALRETKETRYDDYLRQLRHKMRRIMIRYGLRLKIDFEEERWLFERAFPELMYIYWTAVGITNKLKRGLRTCRK